MKIPEDGGTGAKAGAVTVPEVGAVGIGAVTVPEVGEAKAVTVPEVGEVGAGDVTVPEVEPAATPHWLESLTQRR